MKKFSVFLLAFVLLLSMSTVSFAESPEPVYLEEFFCYGQGDLPCSSHPFMWNGYFYENGRLYYVMLDDCIYETTAILFDVTDGGDPMFILGDVNPVLDGTFVFSSDCPFMIQLFESGSVDFNSTIIFSPNFCSEDEHTHTFAIYDEKPSAGDVAQDFMDSLNNGALEGAGGILDGSLEELPDVSDFSNFSGFLAASLAWIPAGWWFVFRLCLVMLVARVVMGFLWR